MPAHLVGVHGSEPQSCPELAPPVLAVPPGPEFPPPPPVDDEEPPDCVAPPVDVAPPDFVPLPPAPPLDVPADCPPPDALCAPPDCALVASLLALEHAVANISENRVQRSEKLLFIIGTFRS